MTKGLTKEHLKELLSQQLGVRISSLDLDPVGGGSINNTSRITLNNTHHFFLKTNTASEFPDLFKKEKSGLELLAGQSCILTPGIVYVGSIDNVQLLVLDWVREGSRNESFWKKFGEQLAQLHRVTNNNFGFVEDNYMGSLRQRNSYDISWPAFFIANRLRPQIELALRNRLLQKNHADSFEVLFDKLPSIFKEESPSLIHGDLWSGNFMCNENSLPVLIDPAVYFGHRSMDIAMTTLFGGFDRAFYESYHYHFPLPSNYQEQWDICNLYPLLIHLNLFGAGYLNSIEAILRRYREW